MYKFCNNIFSLLLTLSSLSYIVLSDCCIKFTDDKCVECPVGMHLFRDNCLYDVKNCQSYKDGFQCQKCQPNYQFINKLCISSSKIQNPDTVQKQQKNSTSQNNKNDTTTKNTTSQSNYTVIQIDFHNLKAINDSDLVDEYVISDQIFKSNYHTELKNATTEKAQQVQYDNGTINIRINYRNIKNQTYNAVMLANINTFIFKEIYFNRTDIQMVDPKKDDQKNITEKQKNITTQNPIQSNPIVQINYLINFHSYGEQFIFPQQTSVSKEIDFLNTSQIELVALLDQQAMSYMEQESKKLAEGKVKKTSKIDNSSIDIQIVEMQKSELKSYSLVKSQFLIIYYKTNDKDIEFIAIGYISQIKNQPLPIQLMYAGFDKNILTRTKKVIIQNNSTSSSSPPPPTKLLQNNQTKPINLTQTPPVKQANSSTSSSSSSPSINNQTKIYQNMFFTMINSDNQLLNDIYYLISINQITTQYKQFQDIVAQKVYKSTLQGSATNKKIKQLQKNIYYKVVFIDDKKQSYEVIVHCNIDTYEAKVDQMKKYTSINQSQNNSITANNASLSTGNVSTLSNNTLINNSTPSTKNQTSVNNTSLIISKFIIPQGYTKAINIGNLTSNVYYLIAMDTLMNKDKSYSEIKPVEVYIKDQVNASKIYFLFKYTKISAQKQSSTWQVVIQVSKSNFKGQVVKNQFVENLIPQLKNQQPSNQPINSKNDTLSTTNQTISSNITIAVQNSTNQSVNYKQQNQRAQQLKKNDLLTKNTTQSNQQQQNITSNQTHIPGKIIMVRTERQRILLDQSSRRQSLVDYKSHKNLRQIHQSNNIEI